MTSLIVAPHGPIAECGNGLPDFTSFHPGYARFAVAGMERNAGAVSRRGARARPAQKFLLTADFPLDYVT
jgi:hypothetical protein